MKIKIKTSFGDRIFVTCNYTLLFLLALVCVLPFIHIVAVSFSSSAEATAGFVSLWPKQFTLSSYNYAFRNAEFIAAFFVSIKRVVLGVSLDMFILVLTAYPLSKSDRQMPGRTAIAWIFVITMFVSGGLIPTYLIVTATQLTNTIWALILPGMVQAFNITVLLNFFRQLPKELEESALIDGAGQMIILFRIYLPLSLPALATLIIFDSVGHWNEWFSAIIYMDSQKLYPLQTYLRSIIVDPNRSLLDVNQLKLLSKVSSQTFKAAQILIATFPILCAYPFLQRYFIKGLTLGSLKG